MTLAIVPASPAHIGPIANRMRAIDALECRVFGHAPKSALRSALAGSAMAWTAKVDGRPECLFGVTAVSSIDGIGSPWMLGTDEIARHARAMVEVARGYVDLIQSQFPRLENRVHADNDKAQRWLRALGFVIEPAALLVSGEPMLRFYRSQSAT